MTVENADSQQHLVVQCTSPWVYHKTSSNRGQKNLFVPMQCITFTSISFTSTFCMMPGYGSPSYFTKHHWLTWDSSAAFDSRPGSGILLLLDCYHHVREILSPSPVTFQRNDFVVSSFWIPDQCLNLNAFWSFSKGRCLMAIFFKRYFFRSFEKTTLEMNWRCFWLLVFLYFSTMLLVMVWWNTSVFLTLSFTVYQHCFVLMPDRLHYFHLEN